MDFSREIAARTVWCEARGEGAAGMAAVAHVLWNRTRDGRWGPSLTSVCLSPYQFSCWNTADPNRWSMGRLADGDPVLQACRDAIDRAANDADPTGAATHYLTADVLEHGAPLWVTGATRTAQIGHHVFFKGVK